MGNGSLERLDWSGKPDHLLCQEYQLRKVLHWNVRSPTELALLRVPQKYSSLLLTYVILPRLSNAKYYTNGLRYESFLPVNVESSLPISSVICSSGTFTGTNLLTE